MKFAETLAILRDYISIFIHKPQFNTKHPTPLAAFDLQTVFHRELLHVRLQRG